MKRILARRPYAPLEAREYFQRVERGMIFFGMISSTDPPRPERKAAFEKCRLAGTNVIMTTGVNPVTAQALPGIDCTQWLDYHFQLSRARKESTMRYTLLGTCRGRHEDDHRRQS